MLVGRHATDPKNNYFETTRLTIRTEPPQPITLDGEHGGETPVEITVAPHALRIFAPAAYIEGAGRCFPVAAGLEPMSKPD